MTSRCILGLILSFFFFCYCWFGETSSFFFFFFFFLPSSLFCVFVAHRYTPCFFCVCFSFFFFFMSTFKESESRWQFSHTLTGFLSHV